IGVEERLTAAVDQALDPANRQLTLVKRAVEEERVGLVDAEVVARDEAGQEQRRRHDREADEHARVRQNRRKRLPPLFSRRHAPEDTLHTRAGRDKLSLYFM